MMESWCGRTGRLRNWLALSNSKEERASWHGHVHLLNLPMGQHISSMSAFLMEIVLAATPALVSVMEIRISRVMATGLVTLTRVLPKKRRKVELGS